MNKRDLLVDNYDDELLFADGFDDAIIGYCEHSGRVIYSCTKCIDELIEQGMTEEEALEYFYYNVSGAYVGEKTPIWSNDFLFAEE